MTPSAATAGAPRVDHEGNFQYLTPCGVECPILYRKNTKCDDMIFITQFLVPFGPIFQIFFLKIV